MKSNFEDQAPKMLPTEPAAGDRPNTAAGNSPNTAAGGPRPRELGGREGPEPTRFGDWELRGRCIDF